MFWGGEKGLEWIDSFYQMDYYKLFLKCLNIKSNDIITSTGKYMMQRIFNFENKPWELAVSRNMSFWHQCLSNYGHYHHNADFGVHVPLEQLSLISQGTDAHVFYYRENLDAYYEAIRQLIISRERIDDLKQTYLSFADTFLRSLEACKSITPEKWEVFLQEYRRFCSGLMITAAIGRFGAEYLRTLLIQSGGKLSKTDHTIAEITYPDEHTPLYHSQYDLLSLKVRIFKKKISIYPIASLHGCQNMSISR